MTTTPTPHNPTAQSDRAAATTNHLCTHASSCYGSATKFDHNIKATGNSLPTKKGQYPHNKKYNNWRTTAMKNNNERNKNITINN
jgi:hypothetical protein